MIEHQNDDNDNDNDNVADDEKEVGQDDKFNNDGVGDDDNSSCRVLTFSKLS